MALDIIALAKAVSAHKKIAEIEVIIEALKNGLKYKGAVSYYADLPLNAKIGDVYTVKYKGTSGTTPDGTEYVWGDYEGTAQWISLSGGGVEVIANPEETGSTNLVKIKIGGVVYNIAQPINVEANATGTATETLEKLTVGDTIYGIPQGTPVEANPTQSGSTDLEKLKVGETVYNIPEGTVVEANPTGQTSTANLSQLKVGNNTYDVSTITFTFL